MRVAMVVLMSAVLCRAQTTVNGGRVYLGPLKTDGSSSSVDFTTAGSTAPVKTGSLSARAAACVQGQFYFATDSPAGQNLSFCITSGNPGVWSTISGGGGGASGPGISYCAPSGGNGSAYSCTPNPAVTAYTPGLTLALVPDVEGTGGTTTVNANGLGAKSVKLADGTTNPAGGDLSAGKIYFLTYDGTAFRIGGAGGGTASMFFIGTGSGQTLSAGGTTRSFLMSGAGTFNTSAGPVQVGAPKAGTIKNLRVYAGTTSGGGPGSCTVVLNGSNTVLSASLTGDGATAWRTDNTHTAEVNAGDLLSLSCSSGTANTVSIFGIALELQYSGGGGGGTPGGSTGQLQYNNGGSFAGQSPVLSGGPMTLLQRGIEIGYVTLTQGANLTLPAQTGAYSATLATNVPCNIRWEHAVISVTASFTGGIGGLKGKIQHGGTDLTPVFDLTQPGGDTRFYYDHPAPVCLGNGNAGLTFVFNGDGVNSLSGYTAGSVTVEVAGYAAR